MWGTTVSFDPIKQLLIKTKKWAQSQIFGSMMVVVFLFFIAPTKMLGIAYCDVQHRQLRQKMWAGGMQWSPLHLPEYTHTRQRLQNTFFQGRVNIHFQLDWRNGRRDKPWLKNAKCHDTVSEGHRSSVPHYTTNCPGHSYHQVWQLLKYFFC